MIPLIAAGPGCDLLTEETRVELPPEGGVREITRLAVAATPSCPWVEIGLPAGAALEGWTGRSRLGDGTRRRLGPERATRQVRDVAGDGAVRVALPELIQGDRAELEVVRRWEGGLAWTAAPEAGYASIEGPVADATGLRQEGERWWAARAPDAAGPLVATARIGEPVPVARLAQAAPPTDVSRRLTLQVPPGNPQYSLYPGGGSSTRVELSLAFAAGDADRGWVVPVPDGAEVEAESTPRGAADIVRRDDSVLVRLPASEAGARVALAWTEPDAPTFGEGGRELDVRCHDCVVRWEEAGDRRTWWLESWGGEALLPGRAPLVKALDRRFLGVSNPEPGLPNELRGHVAGWDLAIAAWDLLRQRSGVLPGPSAERVGAPDPLWPRRLLRARRSGALSEMEAALTLVAWLRQGRMDARWALARDPAAGAGWGISPAGYVHPLVAVTWDGETRWIDVGCRQCATFDVRPGSAGPALGPVDAGPPAPRGAVRVEVGPEAVAWHLEGAAALVLRERVADASPDSRRAALAAALGAPAATVRDLTGFGDSEAPIDVAIVGPEVASLLAPPATLEWVGDWTVRRPVGPSAPPEPATRAVPGAKWERIVDAEMIVERWTIEDRAADLGALASMPPP